MVAYDHQGVEAETTTALDHLGHSVYMDYLVVQLQLIRIDFLQTLLQD
jgi:hypothetical protein